MKRTIVIITMFVVQLPQLFAGNTTDTLATQKEYFNQAKAEIEQMLSGTKPLDYERAVFVTENAYLGNTISYELYQGVISFHANNVKRLAEANRTPQVFKATLLETEAQQRENYEKLLYNWAIYTYFTDTTAIMYNNDGKNSVYFHLPFAYPTNDPMATLDWSNSQTINLLDDKAANCNAQVALYKILSDRLKTDAKIGTAPSHAYITHSDTKGTTYNIELPTRSFPGAGAIMTVTYTPISAVSSGISMRSLTPSQSVALCLVYLAKGYEHKFGKADKSFPMNCSETALRYDSLCLNAMLLKTEILEEKVTAKHKTATQLQTDKDFIAYQKIVGTLYKKGYREMPIDMKNLIVSHLKQDSANFFLKNRTPRGFQTINPKDDRYATLSWGKFDEVHEPKRFEQFGRAIFDTKTMKISKLVTADSLYNNYPFDPVIAAWQIDPLAHEYPSQSPYAAFNNNPILFIDPSGASGVVSIDKNGNATVKLKVILYSDVTNDIEMNALKDRITTLVNTRLTTVRNVPYGPNSTPDRTSTANVSFDISFDVITDYSQAVSDAKSNSNYENNYFYVACSETNKGGYQSGNGGILTSDASAEQAIHEILFSLYKTNGELHKNSSNEKSFLYGGSTGFDNKPTFNQARSGMKLLPGDLAKLQLPIPYFGSTYANLGDKPTGQTYDATSAQLILQSSSDQDPIVPNDNH